MEGLFVESLGSGGSSSLLMVDSGVDHRPDTHQGVPWTPGSAGDQGSLSQLSIRSATTIVGRLVFAAGIVGMTDASATYSLSMPWTAPREFTTAPVPGVRTHRAGPDGMVTRADPATDRPRETVGVVVPDPVSGVDLRTEDEVGQRWGPADLARYAGGLDHRRDVVGMA